MRDHRGAKRTPRGAHGAPKITSWRPQESQRGPKRQNIEQKMIKRRAEDNLRIVKNTQVFIAKMRTWTSPVGP